MESLVETSLKHREKKRELTAHWRHIEKKRELTAHWKTLILAARAIRVEVAKVSGL